MKDLRIEKLAKMLVNYSVSIQKGEKCLIEAFGIDNALVKALVKEVSLAGGYPFVTIRDNSVIREIINSSTEESIKLWATMTE